MDVVYALKLAIKHASVNAKCGAAKICGLYLRFSSSNLSSHTSIYFIPTIFNYNTIANYI